MLVLTLMACLWTPTDTSSYISGIAGGGEGVLRGVLWAAITSMSPLADLESAVNVTGQLGAAVELQCRVSPLPGEPPVSWMRRQEGQLRLLSVGLDLYSSDNRYSVRQPQPGVWRLRLRTLLESDEGHYECQVPSHPPLVHSVYLFVVVPELEITDERDVPIKDKFYNAGSTIQLKCRLTRVPRPSHFLLWRHGADILNYDMNRGGISVRTDLTEDGAWSRLLVAHASARDSGNYSCSLADVAGASVTVHVLNGETPAAMQHGGSSHPRTTHWTLLLTLIIIVCR